MYELGHTYIHTCIYMGGGGGIVAGWASVWPYSYGYESVSLFVVW